MPRSIAPCAVALALLTTLTTQLYSATPAARPTTVTDPAGCVTAECHAAVKASKVVHGPIAGNTCDACHELKDAKAHTFALIRQNAEMCTFCHELSTEKKATVHKPVTLGECLACHDPHGGEARSMLRDKTTAETCARCHENINRDRKFLHTPSAKGACDTCHAPHASKFPKLLDVVGVDLCLTCHRDLDARMAKAKVNHKAIDEGCDKCHDPHGAAEPMAIRQPIGQLCLTCHEKVKTHIDEARDKHSVVTSDRACLTCHTPHGGDLASLMADIPAKICMNCHDKAIDPRGNDGRTVAAMAQIADAKSFKHGPIREGQCGGCHDVHGGQRDLLLHAAYSDKLYLPPDSDEYALCFKCHDARMVKDAKAPTQFRNGENNLHVVHVSTGKRGHNCRTCHDTHAGANDRLVQDSFTLGKSIVPIGFVRSDTGGTCTTGCHLQFGYDRDSPLPVTPLTTQPAPIARTPLDELFKPWTGKDIKGAAVTLPHTTRPSLIVIIGPEVNQAKQALAQVKLAIAASPDVEVVVIVAGPKAAEQATTLSGDASVPWPVIADEADVLSEKLGVRGWPTTVVLRPDGQKVATIAGAPASLAIRLAPYLDFAAGKIDRHAVEQHAIKSGIVTDDPQRQAEWDIQMAQKLLEEGQPQRARKVLAEAIRDRGPTPRLQAAMAHTLLQLGQAKEALTLIDQPAATAVWDADQHDVLRAQALVALEDWVAAKKTLLAAVERNPKLAQAHYLLGQVYEHENDWPKAAAAYRKSNELSRGK
ncbi:MAG: cytochrome c3 family protein [Phycisphaeraceae bacterium]